MGNLNAKENTKMTMLTIHENNKSVGDEIISYFQRPYTYFCFGVPLMVPSLVLLVITSLEEPVSSGFFITSVSLFLLAMLCIAAGVFLGIRDLRKASNLQNENSQLIAENPPFVSDTGPSPFGKSSNFNSLPSSVKSSANSSQSSLIGQSKSPRSVKIMSTVDKSKLLTLKSKGMRRKRSMKFPVEKRLPAVAEEDPHIRSLSRGNTQYFGYPSETSQKVPNTSGSARTKVKTSLDDLKDYLSAIGLGSAKEPVLSPRDQPDDKTSRSMGETDHAGPRKEPLLNLPKSARERRQVAPASTGPILVMTSHERTGLRMPNVGSSNCGNNN